MNGSRRPDFSLYPFSTRGSHSSSSGSQYLSSFTLEYAFDSAADSKYRDFHYSIFTIPNPPSVYSTIVNFSLLKCSTSLKFCSCCFIPVAVNISAETMAIMEEKMLCNGVTLRVTLPANYL